MGAPTTGRALVGVSACLLGEEVRHDGGHKRDGFISGPLTRAVELRPVCPEVDIGLGVPREPIELARRGDDLRLVASESGTDLTAAMRSYAEAKVQELDAAGICGYVLKSRSPSCGLGSVPIDDTETGDGLFAAALSGLCELLPLVEETGLVDDDAREVFLQRVLAYRRLRDLFDGEWTIDNLIGHHTRQELLLMAQSPELHSERGRLGAAGGGDPAEVEDSYRRLTMEAFRKKAGPARHADALSHMQGYLQDRVQEAEYRELERKIGLFCDGDCSLSRVLDDFRLLVKKHSVDYLAAQVYLDPQPFELLYPTPPLLNDNQGNSPDAAQG